VVRDLGGFSLFSWVFSSYLLTQTVTIPVYGKLADLWGRKPILITGDPDLPGRVRPVRVGLEHGQPDLLPRAAGSGRRIDHGDRQHARR
jgi:hypothetical protein